MISTDEIKSYLRITHTKDDSFITGLIDIAKAYIKEQTGVEYIQNDFVYELALRLMIAHFYNNRSPVSEKTVSAVPFSLESMLIHLRIRGAFEVTNG